MSYDLKSVTSYWPLCYSFPQKEDHAILLCTKGITEKSISRCAGPAIEIGSDPDRGTQCICTNDVFPWHCLVLTSFHSRMRHQNKETRPAFPEVNGKQEMF